MADLNSKYVTQGEWNVLSSDVSSLLMVVHVSLYNPTIKYQPLYKQHLGS